MLLNETTLVRMIANQYAEEKLQVFNMSMDLEAVPVRLKKNTFDPFYNFVL